MCACSGTSLLFIIVLCFVGYLCELHVFVLKLFFCETQMTIRKCYLCGAKSPAVTLHSFPKNIEETKLWKKICGLRENDDVCNCLICSKHFVDDDYPEPNAKKLKGSLRLKPGRFPSKKVPFKIKRTSCDLTLRGSESSTNIKPTNQEKPSTSTISVPPIQAGTSSEISQNSSTSTVFPPNEPGLPTISTSSVSQSLGPTIKISLLPSQIVEAIYDTPKKRKFFEPRYVGDITSSDVATPRKAMKALRLVKERLEKETLKNRALAAKNRRLIKKITTMQGIIDDLKKKIPFERC